LIDPTNTIELWDRDTLVAVIHANRSGVHLECAAGWEPDPHGLAVDVQRPFGVLVGLRRS
jgi:hypothetical protein